jgi:hypothetical protein
MNSVGGKRRPDLGLGSVGERRGNLGKLVPFEKRSRADSGARPVAPPTNAEILIFTGIRYERGTPTVPTKPPASSSGGKRKRG